MNFVLIILYYFVRKVLFKKTEIFKIIIFVLSNFRSQYVYFIYFLLKSEISYYNNPNIIISIFICNFFIQKLNKNKFYSKYSSKI